MIFAWDNANRDHIAKHNVEPVEAEYVVRTAEDPYPQTIEDDKFVVWGTTENGRHLQVIFVFKSPEEVSYESLAVHDWIDVEGGDVVQVIRVIHAMDLTPQMKRQLKRRRR